MLLQIVNVWMMSCNRRQTNQSIAFAAGYIAAGETFNLISQLLYI